MDNQHLRIGTCSWKYDSWQGIIYPENKPFNYLKEYSRHYNTVEVDQWFWSLFAGDKAVLPKPSVVQEYADSVPAGFQFGIKVPNSITLTHHYKKSKADPLAPNPRFLSVDLMNRFLERIEPLSRNMGPLMFQFEYLNKQKMPGGLKQFIDLFGDFAEQLPTGFQYSIETRNPNYLNRTYFDFLNSYGNHGGFHHVFLQGYYMPSIFDLYENHKDQLKKMAVIRLHGPDRKGIEKQTGKDWSQVVAPKDEDITSLIEMLSDMDSQGIESFVFVNNHFEGSAPRTIAKIEEALA
ncbi:MAG: DUF72 domain-containing protein [Desulforhopalus sp.]